MKKPPYRYNPNNTNKRTKKDKKTDFDNNPHHETDVRRPQMTSGQPQTNQLKLKRTN